MIKRNRIGHAVAAITLGCASLAFVSSANAMDLRDWGRKLPSSERFVVLSQFGGQAVLDKETQLVWQRTPSPSAAGSWSTARAYCLSVNLGRRLGWRLPSLHELNSLVEPTASGQLALPAGHPFQNVPVGFFWTTTRYGLASDAGGGIYAVSLMANDPGQNGPFSLVDPLVGGRYSWCVRGESSVTEH